MPVRIVARLRLVRESARKRRAWRAQIAAHFGRGPERFLAVATNPWIRLGLIDSGFDAAAVEHVPHGVLRREPPAAKIGAAEAKSRLGLPADSVLLTMFGFVAAYKGHIQAVGALKRLPPRFHLAVVGGAHPHFGDRTLNTILEMWDGEDPRRLIVTGYAPRETIDLYHAATDICLAPVLPEFQSASGSICWALTSGKPTIASRVPVFADIHREAGCLLLATPNTVHELAWHIQRLAGDEELKRTLARNALRYAERFSWDRMTDRLFEIYQRVSGVIPAVRFAQAARETRLRRAA